MSHFLISSSFTRVAWSESERFLRRPKFRGQRGKIDLWLCHFLNQTGLVNQQKRGEIKTLKIFKPGQERASFKNTEEPQNHRASLTFGEHLCRGSLRSVGEEAGMPRLSDHLQSKHERSQPRPEQHLSEGHVGGE